VLSDGFLHVLKIDAEALAFRRRVPRIAVRRLVLSALVADPRLATMATEAGANSRRPASARRVTLCGRCGIDLEFFAAWRGRKEIVAGTELARR